MNALNFGQNNVVTLKPCPFCGGKAAVSKKSYAPIGVLYGVYCDECNDVTLDCRASSEEGAAAAWNRRHDETPSEFERLCGKESSHV